VEEPKRFMREDHQGRKLCSHEKQFYPANSYALLHRPTYHYQEQADPEKDPRRFRKEDGRVKSKPRQLQTNIQSRVISDYFKPIKNVSDPFERKHDIEWERQRQEKAKEAEQPFSPNKFRSDSFNSTRDLLNDHEVKRTVLPPLPSDTSARPSSTASRMRGDGGIPIRTGGDSMAS
jgi:hypothetical protein